ncbi:MAG: sigma-70 family RNA polymerase sigma factor [Alphaproteobacteria bacterium]|nr:sigma-70 family RNA polymerase sigma factor [Alphaproteobacteria bacterium]MBR2137535.1 sigma-70 family RNA polymerase sigma factor [Alphaproteobacteria bacterium]
MNNYRHINPIITKLVHKYAISLFNWFGAKMDIEDCEQQLILAALISLQQFDPKKGHIKSFLNRSLFQKIKEIKRNAMRDKRKIDFYTCSIYSEQLTGKSKRVVNAITN